MRRFLLLIVCLIPSCAAYAQTSSVAPLQIATGTVLTFHLQTRIKSGDGDALSLLPRDTVLRVKMLDSIDSAVNHDGDSFRALILSPLMSGDKVIVHAEAEAHGVLALLRSQSHPEGFRYELLLTGLTDHGQSFVLTASMDSLFPDAPRTAEAAADAVVTKDPDKRPGGASN